jgi:shikimate dehydrogenase
LFAQQTGQHLGYDAMLVAKGEFDNAVEQFRNDGGRGLNVTLPFKQDAFRWVEDCSERAQLAEAVNTIILQSGQPCAGDNTDGVGLVRDLTNNHLIDIKGKRVLILGAGGAVRGILPALLAAAPERVVLANRTLARAVELVTRFEGLGSLVACGFDELVTDRFDLVINGTSASLSGDLPPLPKGLLNAGAVCYDMAYGTEPTAFVHWGRTQNAAMSVDGLGMLVEQAAESFYLWRGVRPDTGPVIAALRHRSA